MLRPVSFRRQVSDSLARHHLGGRTAPGTIAVFICVPYTRSAQHVTQKPSSRERSTMTHFLLVLP